MLKIEVNKGDISSELNGNLAELCTDLISVVHVVYYQIKTDNEPCAEELKKIFLKNAHLAFEEDEDIMNAIKEDDKKNIDVREEVRNNIKNKLSEIVQMLDDGKPLDEILNLLQKEIEK
jgi:hypothetical protein